MKKNNANLLILLIAILSFVWAFIAANFTLSGNVERARIEPGESSYWLSVLKLMFGTEILGIYIFSWFGLLMLGFLVFRKLRGRLGGKGTK